MNSSARSVRDGSPACLRISAIRRSVGADDAAARREPERLQHTWIPDVAGGDGEIVVEGNGPEPGLGDASLAEPLSHHVLVAGGGGRRHGVRGQAQPLGDGGCDHGGQIIDADDGVDRVRLAEPAHRLGGRFRVVEIEGQEVIGRLLREDVGPLRSAHDLDAERTRGVEERLGAIRGGRQEK